jgi:hypothetical protein
MGPELDPADLRCKTSTLAVLGNCTLGALIDRRGRYLWCCSGLPRPFPNQLLGV